MNLNVLWGGAKPAGMMLMLTGLLLVSGTPAAAQDKLSAARELYVAAQYEEALALLTSLTTAEPDTAASIDRIAVEQYRAFCFLALGRSTEADTSLAIVISADPLRRIGEADASPRLRAAFRDARRKLLPGLALERYAAAKTTFQQKNFVAAEMQFRQVLALLDDPDMDSRQPDLRMLVAGFLDLSVASMAAPQVASAAPPAAVEAPALARVEAPAVSAPHVAPPGVVPADGVASRIYSSGDGDVSPPRIVRQVWPAVPTTVKPKSGARSAIEVIIDEAGHVASAAVREPVHPVYDAMVLAAANTWQYQPATRDGVAVRYRKLIQVTLPSR